MKLFKYFFFLFFAFSLNAAVRDFDLAPSAGSNLKLREGKLGLTGRIKYPITVSGGAQDDVIKIHLNTSNFDYGLSQSGGTDLYFEDSAAAPLDFWLDYWNAGSTSTCYIQLSTASTVYLYSGGVFELFLSTPGVFAYYNDFETETAGQIPSGSTASVSGKTDIAVRTDAGNKVLRKENLTGGVYFLGMPVAIDPLKISVFEFDISQNAANVNSTLPYFRIEDDKFVSLYFGSDRNVYYHDGTWKALGIQYSSGTWYRAAYIMNPAASEWTLDFSGTSPSEAAAFRTGPGLISEADQVNVSTGMIYYRDEVNCQTSVDRIRAFYTSADYQVVFSSAEWIRGEYITEEWNTDPVQMKLKYLIAEGSTEGLGFFIGTKETVSSSWIYESYYATRTYSSKFWRVKIEFDGALSTFSYLSALKLEYEPVSTVSGTDEQFQVSVDSSALPPGGSILVSPQTDFFNSQAVASLKNNPTLNLVNGTAYDISVYNSSGTVITSPLTRHATIYFTYDANQFAGREDDLFILKYSSGSWSSTDSVVDKSNHQVKLMTDTFSTFVLAIRQSPALRIIDGLKVYPNPFNPNNQDITLSYVAAESGELEARIFTVTGELVKKWKFRVSGDPSGLIPNTFIWDGKNGGGMICANGTYLLSLKLKTDAGREKEIRSKIVILK